jgi:hypothetical protein
LAKVCHVTVLAVLYQVAVYVVDLVMPLEWWLLGTRVLLLKLLSSADLAEMLFGSGWQWLLHLQ